MSEGFKSYGDASPVDVARHARHHATDLRVWDLQPGPMMAFPASDKPDLERTPENDPKKPLATKP